MELTRRGFLAGSLAACGLAAAGAGMFTPDSWLSPAVAYAGIGPSGAERAASGEEHTACTYHQKHCGGMCPLKCTVRDGRLVKVEPNTCVDDRYETICLKGISEVQHIYGAGRVQTPLKRVGERGSNEFVQVSWDEALDSIVSRIKEIQRDHGKQAVMVTSSSEANMPFLASLLGAQTGGNAGIDVGMGNGLDPAIGYGGGFAMATGEARDWVNSRMVLMVGCNFCESSLPQVRLFFEAKEAGARIVSVDPHFSTTAGKADEWVPIEPGTDAALFLAMTSVILDEGLADRAFMAAHTSLPFLIDASTGRLVRQHAEDPQAEKPQTGAENPFFVIDSATGQPVPYNQPGVSAALSGEVVVDGVRARTAYDALVEGQKEFTAAWAEGITGIPAAKIESLARAYAKGPSSLALGWGGNDKMGNADIAGHAAAVLASVTGNICKPGANVGVFVGGCWNGHSTTLGSWELPDALVPSEDEMAAYDMRTKPNSVKAYICCGDLVAQHFANMSKTEDWVRTLDLIVSIDPYFTEGAKWADYVLPATTRFELDAEVGAVKVGYNQIVLQNKVIDPLFEARTDFWIQKEFAKRLGCEDALPKDSTELASAILSGAEDPQIASLTIDQINEHHGTWPLPGIEKPRQEYADFAFDTVSGRLDLYYQNLVPFGQELPQWEPTLEANAQNPLRSEFPLQLANVRTRFHIHNQFNDAKWIQQYFEPTLDANPADLSARGLATGDVVEVFNDRGSFEVRVHANPSIRPGSIRLVEGATADYLARGNMQSVTNDATVERGDELLCGPVIPFSDTLVEIRKA